MRAQNTLNILQYKQLKLIPVKADVVMAWVLVLFVFEFFLYICQLRSTLHIKNTHLSTSTFDPPKHTAMFTSFKDFDQADPVAS